MLYREWKSMVKPSRARQFFDTLVAGGTTAIEALIEPPTYETDWLDFKEDRPDGKTPEETLKAPFAKALTGFANSEGGVIVLGIRAKKAKRGDLEIDAATALAPILNPEKVREKFRQLIGELIDPPLGNVQLESFPSSADTKKGYLVCFVPEGPFKPYRTNGDDKRQFFIRLGDRTEVMNRSMIQTMFYPRATVRFVAMVSLRYRTISRVNPRGTEDVYFILLQVCLMNEGTATARNVHVGLPKYSFFKAVRPGSGWELFTSEQEHHFISSTPIHPGMRSRNFVGIDMEGDSPPYFLDLKMQVTCDDHQPQFFRMKIGMPASLTWEKEPQTLELEFTPDSGVAPATP